MDQKRRNFLKIAGISTLAGLGAGTGLGHLVDGAQSALAATAAPQGNTAGQHSGTAPSGRRYGLLIDARKFRENPALGERVVRACHERESPVLRSPRELP